MMKLRLTFRIVFFYSVMFVVGMAIMVWQSFRAMKKKMRAELAVVWNHKEQSKSVER